MLSDDSPPEGLEEQRERDSKSIDPTTRRRVLSATFIGNFVEWFDYGVYGYLAVTISTVFFPAGDPQAALLSTFAVFAVSFISRPFVALILGTIGDRHGRRTALSMSILIMTGATFLIALLPTYEMVGMLAPALMLLLRLIQGFSASGEYAGAASFLVEYAPPRKRGVYGAVVPASTASGLLLGSLLAALLSAVLTEPSMQGWGWRLPFLLAAPLGLIGLYIRLKLEDTPNFKALEADNEVDTTPVRDLFTQHWKPMLFALGGALLNAVGFYVILTYMPTYLSEELGFGSTESFLATTIALVTYIGLIFLTGMASDRFGRRTLLVGAGIGFVVLTVPAFMVLGSAGFLAVVLIQIVLGGLLTMNDGTLPTFLAELFPTKVRYSGFAVSFNVANAVFGGTAPFMATFLIGWSGSDLAPAWYLVAAAIISGVVVLFARETSHRPLRDT